MKSHLNGCDCKVTKILCITPTLDHSKVVCKKARALTIGDVLDFGEKKEREREFVVDFCFLGVSILGVYLE